MKTKKRILGTAILAIFYSVVGSTTGLGQSANAQLRLGNGTFSFLPYQDRSERGWSSYKTLTGDVNGDGLTDLIWNSTADINRTYVGLANRNGTFSFLSYQDRSEGGWTGYETLTGDVNGDGLTDLIWNSKTNTNRTYVGLANSNGTFRFLPKQDRSEGGWTGFKTLTGDVNGDGLTDLIWNSKTNINRTYVGLANSNGTFRFLPKQDRSEGGWTGYETLTGDVNGDGLTDLIWNSTADINRTYVGLANRNGTFSFLPYQDRSERGWSSYKTLTGDVNGDGLTDLIWNSTADINRIYVGLAN